MINYPEAIARITRLLEAAPAAELRPGDAVGAGISQAVASRLDVPDFDNAAMDGIAVRAADLATASPSAPVALRIAGVVPAGHKSETQLEAGQAMEIMTGAPLPPGADTVIAVERLQWREETTGDKYALIAERAETGRNVRRAGEDFHRGDVLLHPGAWLGPEAVMNLAAGGVDAAPAIALPRVSIITTGSELTATGTPTGTGQIRDSNGPYLGAALGAMGGSFSGHHRAADTPAEVATAIAAAADEAQVVITTGGVSAGKFDCVPAAVSEAGGDIVFHKVAIRPGKPILFASLPGGHWLFGLPGNPVAVAVGLRFFVAPALRALRGLPPEQSLKAVSASQIHKRAGLRFFGKAHAAVSETGQIEVRLLPGQESFRVRPLLDANCWAIVPEHQEAVVAGELIEIAPLHPTRFLQAN